MLNPVPAFTNSLTALSKILDKAEAHAEARNIKPEVIPQLRLVADMLPFWRQVTIACDHAKGACARLSLNSPSQTSVVQTERMQLRNPILAPAAAASSPSPGYQCKTGTGERRIERGPGGGSGGPA